jgi:hypothetical protein
MQEARRQEAPGQKERKFVQLLNRFQLGSYFRHAVLNVLAASRMPT